MQVGIVNSNKLLFKSKKLSPEDLEYKRLLQKGLKDTYDITCKVENLDSIAGPNELKSIIERLNPRQYEAGEDFRANFHIHTNASDGRLTPKEFLELCKDWADNIFKSGKTRDGLPAFSAAITDHNRIKSVKETIAIIAKEPNKYKNFKFVVGCEFMFNGYKKPHSAFEAVGLGFNPFDQTLQPMMKGFSSNNQVSDIKKVLESGGILSWAHPIITPNKINDDFFSFLKDNGIGGVEGNYQYKKWNREYINTLRPILEKFINKFKMFVTGGTDSHVKSIF